MKNLRSPLIYLVWSVLRLSGFISLLSRRQQRKALQLLLMPAFSSQTLQRFCRAWIFRGIIDRGFSFVSLLLTLTFQEVKVFLVALQTLSKGVTFGPGSTAWEDKAGPAVAGTCCFCCRAGKKFTWVYQAGPDIYSNIFVYPVPSLFQCLLLRILALKHITKSAL